MVQVILMWAGAVLALGLLLVMALGPVIVEVDSWWYERRHNRRRSAREDPEPARPATVVARGVAA